MNILEAKEVSKCFIDHQALNKVSISVPRNSIYGLLGPNGAGKTTLIRIINQITTPDSGEVLFDGKPLHPDDIAHFGYLPEERGLYKKMKVAEQIVFLAQLKGVSKKDAVARMDQWLDKFEIANWKNKKVMELSKGMQQKIQFITTVIHEPKLLIFDEPFSGFDPINTELIKHEILGLKERGTTLILSTHNMNSVEELCNEISLINKSQVILQGEVSTIRQQFKKNIFRLHIEDTQELNDNEIFEVISRRNIQGGIEALIQLRQPAPSREVIQQLCLHHNLIAFEEQLPSMQEVFIEAVTKSSHK